MPSTAAAAYGVTCRALGNEDDRGQLCAMRLRDIRHTPEQIQAAMRAEIAARYRNGGRSTAKRRPLTFAAIRAAEITKLYRARYGRQLPDTDEGILAARIMAHHLGRLRDATRRISSWLDRWAPWLDLQEGERLIREATECPLKWRADKLAWKLRVTAAERANLGIRTIGAIDQTKEQRKQAAAERRRHSQEARRRQEGAKPRAEYEASAQGKPWNREGISRATWYRRRANPET